MVAFHPSQPEAAISQSPVFDQAPSSPSKSASVFFLLLFLQLSKLFSFSKILQTFPANTDAKLAFEIPGFLQVPDFQFSNQTSLFFFFFKFSAPPLTPVALTFLTQACYSTAPATRLSTGQLPLWASPANVLYTWPRCASWPPQPAILWHSVTPVAACHIHTPTILHGIWP